MWAYFNVPEARYLEYMASSQEEKDNIEVELQLANGEVFPKPGKIGAIEGEFNNETGNIAFRADFDNPSGVLRHGQTGTVLLHRKIPGAIVIPQRATYEILAKRYVYVVEPADKKHDGDEHEGEHEHEHEHEAVAGHDGEHAEKGPSKHGVIRQREIVVQDELDDLYVIQEGLGVDDAIVFEGVRQVRDGQEVEYEVAKPETLLENLKFAAE
jgi:membrane fusion protein (multidrug efflux system)